ncbi:hypothetical protein JTB14_032778 [Gonioctena quinquepunctata]|nr:hypothetical protein JTB14_032778 [Gonioctena quinquepunctata]
MQQSHKKIRKCVLFIYKEEKLEMKNKNVAFKRRTKRKEKCADEGFTSQENWQKRRKKKETNFNGSTLTKILNSRNKSNGTVDPCLYCGVGLSDQTAIWYGCDKCEGWVHALCENYPPENESDKYFRKFCLAAKKSIEQPLSTNTTSSKIHCIEFFDKEYKKSLDELLDIERETRNQSECPLWVEERHKRITAYFFGIVVKASLDSTIEKVALKIITQPKYYEEVNNELIGIDDWSCKLLSHDRQTDGFNCGHFILYFFERFINGQSLEKDIDMIQYRNHIQNVIIRASDSITNRCLFCG